MTLMEDRRTHSEQKILLLKEKLKNSISANNIEGLTIFTAGSVGRLEASEHSDLDLFFIIKGSRDKIDNIKTKEIMLFSDIIKIGNDMGLPPFSNDSQYLKIIDSECISKFLGSPDDDYENYFTTRMLLFLESKCVFGEESFGFIIDELLERYFKDYHDHPETFGPIFLLNDIHRYWKTLLLNYENKRRINEDTKSVKSKVRNFKIKYSRMTTCFSMIVALGALGSPVNKEKVKQLVFMTPYDRIMMLSNSIPETRCIVDKILKEYEWFMEKTGLSTAELESKFDTKDNISLLFERANKYGDMMYQLVDIVNKHQVNLICNSCTTFINENKDPCIECTNLLPSFLRKLVI